MRTRASRAVWASVVLHVVVACAVVSFVRRDTPPVAQSKIDTRAEVRMSLPEVEVEVTPPSPPLAAVPAQTFTPAQPQAAQETQAPAPPEPTTPQIAVRTPHTLPPEILAKIRLPGANSSPTIGTGVHQASAVAVSAVPRAIHGPLAANQTVVYVLDSSGSMGAGGKFDAARAALVATLKAQPSSVRFQVVVYAGAASPLLPGNGQPLPATDANVQRIADALAKLEPRGRSNHLGAARAAVAFRPDVILILTDADDLDAPALKAVAKSVVLCVGRATADGVQLPQELK